MYLNSFKGEVTFEHVKFGYEDSDRVIIHDFSAKAEPGQKIAIVGPTGAGKSTLVNLSQGQKQQLKCGHPCTPSDSLLLVQLYYKIKGGYLLMRKKLSALFMVFAMVLSLFSGFGVNTVWADDNEEGGTENIITGLAAKDWFDYDGDGQVTKPNDQAKWMKGLGSAADGTVLLVQELDEHGVATGSAINADALTLAYCGDGEEPDNNLQTENVGSVLTYNNDYVQLKFTKTGWYKLYQTEDSSDAIVINVVYKELGFYTTATKTPEGAMKSAVPYTFTSQDSNSIYLITNVPDNVTWNGSLKWEVIANGKNIDESQQERYFEKTEIVTESSKDKTYKITLKKGTFDWMDIRVKATGGENGSTPWAPEEEMLIHYDGNVVGFSTTQEFEWDDAADCPVVKPDATYRKEGWADFSHSAPYQFAKVNENGKVEKTYTKDELTIAPMADGTGDAYLLQDKNVIRIKFNGVGTYKVYAKDNPADYVMISADFNKVGLYTSQTVSVDTVCDSESTLWRDECNELYVIPHGLDDGVTPTYNFSVIPADSDQPIAYDGYYTVEDLQNGNHKIVINKDKNENFTVLVTMEWTENGHTESAEASVWSEKSSSGNIGGGSTGGSTGGASSVTPTPEPTPNPGETTTETKTETTTNSKGNTVKQETTITKNPDGSVASTTTKSEIENIAKNTSASVSVTKDAEGKISAVEATVENTVKPGKSDTVKTTISASVVKQMTDAAGTTDLTIKQTVKDTKGNVLYTVETKAEDLAAGKKLTLVKIENGKKVLVSKPVTVNKNGNVSVKAEEGEYQLLNEKETKALQKEILKTVTPKTGNVSVDKGKKTIVKLSSKLDMDNVAKITYTSSDKSTVKVDKNGNIIAKKKGNVTVKVKVTLKDGTTKTVKVKVKVK